MIALAIFSAELKLHLWPPALCVASPKNKHKYGARKNKESKVQDSREEICTGPGAKIDGAGGVPSLKTRSWK